MIVGNAIHRNNPEAVEAERLGLPVLSMPQALARFFLSRHRPLVVSGTHGKTTTTAMAAWVYTACGADPGYLIGGAPHDLPASFHDGDGERFVIEGDEYNAAYFDRGAKFLHYQPETLILTSAEYDHADLYPSPEALWDAYSQLLRLLPPDGLLVACGDTPKVRELAAASARCRVLFYGLDPANELHPEGEIEARPEGSRFRIRDEEAGEVEIELPTRRRATTSPTRSASGPRPAATACPRRTVASALARFQGVKRRLEELGTGRGDHGGRRLRPSSDRGREDPDRAAPALPGPADRGALRAAQPDRRPALLLRALPRGLRAGADRVLFAPIFHHGRLAPEERLDFDALAEELTAAGTPATVGADTDDLLPPRLEEAREGDVLVTMSSGSFDGMPHRLAQALRG